MSWTDEIRALLLPVAFDRDPRDGLERVLSQQLGPATAAERLRACVAALDTALGSDVPLASIMPSSHPDADVRAYLDAIRTRLRARLAPPPTASAPEPVSEIAIGCEQLLDLCDHYETIENEERDALLLEIETWCLEQLGLLDTLDMDAPPSGRDLAIQGLGILLDAVSAARQGNIHAAVMDAKESKRLIGLADASSEMIDED